MRRKRQRFSPRTVEAILLSTVFLLSLVGFASLSIALQIRLRLDPVANLRQVLLPAVLVGIAFFVLHFLLRLRARESEQIVLPLVMLLFVIGLMLIYRLRGIDGLNQQLVRGLLPGVVVVAAFIVHPRLVEVVRRWTIPISAVGLLLPILTVFFGVVDETGARLALKIGPLPAIQTSEFIKLALIIFLAWYIEREGQAAEGRSRPVLGWLRLPALEYFLPGVLFVSMATLALVQMSDFGAVLILAILFVGMLYAGFETRLFGAVAAIGLGLAVLVGLVLYFTWTVPTVIQYRFITFRNPWSTQVLLVNGQPSSLTISEGPGYQIQQSIYALIAGGVSGTGLGFGSPDFIPLAASDFIFAAVTEELGAVVSLALLICFAILILRIFRTAVLLPQGQTFERLLLVGIGIHFFTQVFVMVGGTMNLIPLTGVTVPFMSLGGAALLVNLVEIGMVLAIARRTAVARPGAQTA